MPLPVATLLPVGAIAGSVSPDTPCLPSGTWSWPVFRTRCAAMKLAANSTSKKDEAILTFPSGNRILTSLIECAELCQRGTEGKNPEMMRLGMGDVSSAHSLGRLQWLKVYSGAPLTATWI